MKSTNFEQYTYIVVLENTNVPIERITDFLFHLMLTNHHG